MIDATARYPSTSFRTIPRAHATEKHTLWNDETLLSLLMGTGTHTVGVGFSDMAGEVVCPGSDPDCQDMGVILGKLV
jgi:hypothetical protein